MAYGIEAIFYGKKKMRGGLVIGLINTVISVLDKLWKWGRGEQ